MSRPLPFILYATLPVEGHAHPAIQICSYLVEQHFDVTLTCRQKWQPTVLAAGIHPAPFVDVLDPVSEAAAEIVPDIPAHIMTSPLPDLVAFGINSAFPKQMLRLFDTLRFAMLQLAHRVSLPTLHAHGLVILSDTGAEGVLPLKLGAYLPPQLENLRHRIKTLGIGVVPRFWATPFHPPWGLGLPYDPSPDGVARNLAVLAAQKTRCAQGEEEARMVLRMLGCCDQKDEKDDDVVDRLFAGYDSFGGEPVAHSLLDANSVCHDVTLQMSMASLEFPLPENVQQQQDLVPSHFKHAGFLPLKKLPADLAYPSWFHELTSPKNKKKVVFVAQGTWTYNYDELVLPTIRALANDPDILVVALLCHRGATLDNENNKEKLPANAHVLDYFPYDAVLPHADVFVSSSGFGGLTHAVANGVPLVQGGWLVDKPDIGMRVEHAGLGVYLGRDTYPADPDTIRTAVRTVLASPDKYKKRALELQAESLAKYQPLDTIKTEILGLAAGM